MKPVSSEPDGRIGGQLARHRIQSRKANPAFATAQVRTSFHETTCQQATYSIKSAIFFDTPELSTHTRSTQSILSPPRLPFRHLDKLGSKSKLRRARCRRHQRDDRFMVLAAVSARGVASLQAPAEEGSAVTSGDDRTVGLHTDSRWS
jgi:hypothetical protein